MITFEELERIVELVASDDGSTTFHMQHREIEKHYQPYYRLFDIIAYGLCVELGVEKGRGCLSMLRKAEMVVGIDSLKRPEIDNIIEEHGHFFFINEPSLPPPAILKNRKIDLLHIDTEHSYSMAKAEFETYKPHLSNPAIVCFDDLHAMDDGVLEYFESLPYRKIQEDRLHPVCGYGVLYYEELELVDAHAHTLEPLPDIEKGRIW